MVVFLIKIRLVTNTAVATEWQLAKHKRSRREETKLREQGEGQALNLRGSESKARAVRCGKSSIS